MLRASVTPNIRPRLGNRATPDPASNRRYRIARNQVCSTWATVYTTQIPTAICVSPSITSPADVPAVCKISHTIPTETRMDTPMRRTLFIFSS